MTNKSAILEIIDLKKSYGDVQVLKDISIDMQKGEFLVLLGPSGCGKSTLLNCIAGLEETNSGDIIIDNTNMNNVPPKERNVAMVFQSYALYPTMSVRENITFGMKIRGSNTSKIDAETNRVANILQIHPLLDRKPAELSGGQRQRVAMGRALVRNPTLFLFDEPLSNLDAKLRVEMRAEIKDLHETVGASIVYVTHDQIEAMTLASKICVLDAGLIQQTGTPGEIYNSPANIFVAQFMGFPAMNMLPADIAGGSVNIQGTNTKFSLVTSAKPLTANDIIIGIRPEDFVIVDASKLDGSKIDGNMSVEIISTENTGPDIFATCKLGELKLIIRLNNKVKAKKGDKLMINLDQSVKHIFDGSGNRL